MPPQQLPPPVGEMHHHDVIAELKTHDSYRPTDDEEHHRAKLKQVRAKTEKWTVSRDFRMSLTTREVNTIVTDAQAEGYKSHLDYGDDRRRPANTDADQSGNARKPPPEVGI